jgi:hypothetical protein
MEAAQKRHLLQHLAAQGQLRQLLACHLGLVQPGGYQVLLQLHDGVYTLLNSRLKIC